MVAAGFSLRLHRRDACATSLIANWYEKHYLSKIILFGEDNTSIGELYFHRHTDTLVDKDYQSESEVIICNFLAEDFHNILDLLRN